MYTISSHALVSKTIGFENVVLTILPNVFLAMLWIALRLSHLVQRKPVASSVHSADSLLVARTTVASLTCCLNPSSMGLRVCLHPHNRSHPAWSENHSRQHHHLRLSTHQKLFSRFTRRAGGCRSVLLSSTERRHQIIPEEYLDT